MFLKSLPNGKNIKLANLKYCLPNGIPIIVTQQMHPHIA
jgi:hypothetical protein